MEKKKLYQLIITGWELAKFYFSRDYKTSEEYGEFVNLGNDLLKKTAAEYGTVGKEYNFMRRMIVAVNEYCDADWREKNIGEQISLWTK